MSENKNSKKQNDEIRQKYQDSVMIKPREIIPIMAQSSDPFGSYTGTSIGADKMPVQDADDL
jgi:murein endopeptidase